MEVRKITFNLQKKYVFARFFTLKNKLDKTEAIPALINDDIRGMHVALMALQTPRSYHPRFGNADERVFGQTIVQAVYILMV
jgi:hypothetical protein